MKRSAQLVAAAALSSAGCFAALDVGGNLRDFRADAGSKGAGLAEAGSGTGCDLEVLGAGPLDGTSSGQNGWPAIVGVGDGFVIAHRQVEGPSYRVVTLKVANSGAAVPEGVDSSLPYHRYHLPGACPGDAESVGLGLSFDQSTASGLLVVPRGPTCVAAIASMMSLDLGGRIASPLATVPLARAALTNVMTQHALSSGHLVHVVDGRPILRQAIPSGLSDGIEIDSGPSDAAWVAATTTGLAVLLQNRDGSLALHAAELSPSSDPFAPPLKRAPPLAGAVSALALQDRRAVVVANEADARPAATKEPLGLKVFDIGTAAYQTLALPAVTGMTGEDHTLHADLAIRGSRLVVARVHATALSLAVYGDFATTPKLQREASLGADLRIGQLMKMPAPGPTGQGPTMSGARVAVALNDATIGLAWINGASLSPGDDVGGWVVLRCNASP